MIIRVLLFFLLFSFIKRLLNYLNLPAGKSPLPHQGQKGQKKSFSSSSEKGVFEAEYKIINKKNS